MSTSRLTSGAPTLLGSSCGCPTGFTRAAHKESETLVSTPVDSSDVKEFRGGAY